jgi:phytoene synthase
MEFPLDSNFAFAFLLLPRRRRHALEAAYGFCRAVDDAVDEVKIEADGLRILADWREQLRLAYSGTPTSAQGVRLAQAAHDFHIEQHDLADILLGVEMDLTTHRYATFADLYTYCYRVASAVGMVAIAIFGAPGARDYAEKLGLALQLTNILRDVGEDADRGRIYLPREDLDRFGVSEDDIFHKRYSPAFVDLMTFEAGRAHRFYEEARAVLPHRGRYKLAAAGAMGRIYFELLRTLEARAFRIFEQRISLSALTKARLAITAGVHALA